MKPRIVITQGDPAGIGPEIVALAVTDPEVRDRAAIVVVGDPHVMRRALALRGRPHRVEALQPTAVTWDLPDDVVGVVDVATEGASFADGRATPAGGHLAVRAIDVACELVGVGAAVGIASAPVSKVALHLAGYTVPGQTELFADRFGLAPDSFHTMLLGRATRVSLVTGHMALRRALEEVRQERVYRVARQALETLVSTFGIERPRLAITGVNPHAGDGGIFGREEVDEIAPASARLRANGFDVTDPRPTEAVFEDAERGRYDGVVCMYHDQGVVPLKPGGYTTIIAGAPFVRTTCGHGTAYDIAWRGVADGRLFARAVRVAIEVARPPGAATPGDGSARPSPSPP